MIVIVASTITNIILPYVMIANQTLYRIIICLLLLDYNNNKHSVTFICNIFFIP